MRKLPEDFELEKYGLKVKLVNYDNAEFILSLRSDRNRTRYMLTLKNNIEYQKKWIQKYKRREREGLDYYFIYYNLENKPIGLSRVSNISLIKKTAKDCSWIVEEGLKYEAIKMIIMRNELVFNLLEINTLWGEVHKKNRRAIRILKLLGSKLKDVGTKYYDFSIIKKDFFEACENELVDKFKYS